MITEALMLIASIAMFFQGFSIRRRNGLILLVSSFIVFLVSGLRMIIDGAGTYVSAISNVDIYEVIVSIAYVLFWLISGYIIGGFQRVTTENVKVTKVK